jgi:hypothetical protein
MNKSHANREGDVTADRKPDNVISQAKLAPTRLTIVVSRTVLEALDRAAQEHQVDRKDMAKSALESWLASEGYYKR